VSVGSRILEQRFRVSRLDWFKKKKKKKKKKEKENRVLMGKKKLKTRETTC
jgi:hypothetical protein